MSKIALVLTGFVLLFASGALAQETITVVADSTMDGHAGSIASDVEPGWTTDIFFFNEGGLMRFYAIRDNGAPTWDVLPAAEYVVKATGMAIDDTWRGLDTDAGQETVATVTAFQTITTPAGPFDCFKVEYALASNPILLDAVFWFSDGVGLVRQDFYDVDIPGNPLTDMTELTSYNVVGGSGYLPMAVGNQWNYQETVAADESTWGQLKSQY